MNKTTILIILIVALVIGNLYQYFTKENVDNGSNNSILMEKIDKNQKKLDSINKRQKKYEIQRNKKINNIEFKLDSITNNITRTKKIENDEKEILWNASENDNISYFTNYIDNYSATRRSDTIE